jgi:hypothetical protein
MPLAGAVGKLDKCHPPRLLVAIERIGKETMPMLTLFVSIGSKSSVFLNVPRFLVMTSSPEVIGSKRHPILS